MCRRALALAFLAAAALGAVPTDASAGRVVFGSDLSAPADSAETHPANTVHWNAALAAQRPGPPGEPGDGDVHREITAAAPTDGQLRYVTIFGGVPPGGHPVRYRFVVLHPQAGGSVSLEHVEQSQLHTMAVSADPRHRVPNKSIDWDVCFHKGDYLGVLQLDAGSLRTFATVPGSVTRWYEGATGLSTGDVFTGSAHQDRELLMEVLEESGRDAFSRCPGGYEDHLYTGLQLRSARLERGADVVRLRPRCPSTTYGRCSGKLSLRTKVHGHEVALGRGRFRIRHGHARTLRLRVSPARAAFLRGKGAVKGFVVTKGHDDPFDPRNRRAPGERPGRQKGTHRTEITLRAPH